MAVLQKNATAVPAIVPDKSNNFMVESKDAATFASGELRVACTEADLLQLGFDIRAIQRISPAESTNAGFEEITIYQRKNIALRCYQEFTLDKPGPDANALTSRSACQQIVPIRLKKK